MFDWKKAVLESTNITKQELDDSPLVDWSWEKMQIIMGKSWAQIIIHAQKNNIRLRNIWAVTAKDTRKTTVWIIFGWFLKNWFPKLNIFVLRDTLERSRDQMRKQVRKAVSLITHEYGVVGFSDYVAESSQSFFLVRNQKSKDNQQIDLLSFNSIQDLGGFTTNNGGPAICIHDELQNRTSSLKPVISDADFISNYKFVDEKLRNIEMTNKEKMPDWIPRHIFLSNRYISDFPINNFTENHFPFYDYVKDGNYKKGIKSWMLHDIVNNNFAVKFLEKKDMKEGWEDFAGSAIVYASTLSNYLIAQDKVYMQEVLDKINRGKKEDLAYYLGDLFEGYGSGNKAYNYTRKTTITREQFHKDYAPFIDEIRISIDIDFTRAMTWGIGYECSKKIPSINKDEDVTIFRTIRGKRGQLICKGKLSVDGARTEEHIRRLYLKLMQQIDRIYKELSKILQKIPKILLIFDDKSAQIPARFNFGIYKQTHLYHAVKVGFDKNWKIWKRPHLIDEMQDTGFVIDIGSPEISELHRFYSEASLAETKSSNKKERARAEGASNKRVDHYNQDEYLLFYSRSKLMYNNVATQRSGGKNKW